MACRIEPVAASDRAWIEERSTPPRSPLAGRAMPFFKPSLLSAHACLALATLWPIATLPAQEPPVPAGARIRVMLAPRATDARDGRRSARRWYGTVERATADSVALRLRDGRAYTFAWSEMDGLERHLGRHTRAYGAGRGALVGGVMVGLFVGVASTVSASACTYECGLNTLAVPVLTVMGSTAGMAIGAVMGAIGPGEHFERVRPVPRAALHLAPGRVGLALALP
jgi:hypothetical protein